MSFSTDSFHVISSLPFLTFPKIFFSRTPPVELSTSIRSTWFNHFTQCTLRYLTHIQIMVISLSAFASYQLLLPNIKRRYCLTLSSMTHHFPRTCFILSAFLFCRKAFCYKVYSTILLTLFIRHVFLTSQRYQCGHVSNACLPGNETLK